AKNIVRHLLARGSLRNTEAGLSSPKRPTQSLSKEPSHDTVTPTHDRTHAAAQPLPGNAEELYPSRHRLCPVFQPEPREAGPRSHPPVSTLPAQRAQALSGNDQPVCFRD